MYQQLDRVLEMRKNFCFVSNHSSKYQEEEKYEKRLNYFTRYLNSIYHPFIVKDPTLNVALYSIYPSFEEIVAYPDDSVLSQIVHYKPKLEDYDYNLPDNQNLWKVMTNPAPTYDEQRRIAFMRNSHSGRFDDEVTNEQIDIICDMLPGREEFEWYSDIVLNLRFNEKVQILFDTDNPDIRYEVEPKLEWLFGVFGVRFVSKFLHDKDDDEYYTAGHAEEAMMFVTNDVLPMKQIKITSINNELLTDEPMDCTYDALCHFLLEDRIQRGIDEEIDN